MGVVFFCIGIYIIAEGQVFGGIIFSAAGIFLLGLPVSRYFNLRRTNSSS